MNDYLSTVDEFYKYIEKKDDLTDAEYQAFLSGIRFMLDFVMYNALGECDGTYDSKGVSIGTKRKNYKAILGFVEEIINLLNIYTRKICIEGFPYEVIMNAYTRTVNEILLME